MSIDATTRRLVDFALAAEYAKLDTATVHSVKRHLIDAFACAAAAFNDPEARIALDVAARHTGVPDATLWATSRTTTPEMAAFANGVLVRCLDLSDTYLGRGGSHPSDMIPALLAVAESAGRSGPELINAVALAYDVYCTMNDAVDINVSGWDQTLYALAGTVLGAGRLLGLSAAQLADAVALALVPNMALRQTRQGELSSWKGYAGPNSARNAVFAANLALLGVTGPSEAFEGRQGLWHVLGPFDWQLPSSPGRHKISECHLKSLPICYHGQSAAWCAVELRDALDPLNVDVIQIETYRNAVSIMANDSTRWSPDNRETADHSLPFVVAAALVDGVVSATSFERKRWQDPAIVALMRRVEVKECTELTALYPLAAPSRVTIRMRSGEVLAHEMRYPRGHALNPMTDAQVEEKYRECFRGHGAENNCLTVLDRLWHVDEVDDLRKDLLGLLAVH